MSLMSLKRGLKMGSPIDGIILMLVIIGCTFLNIYSAFENYGQDRLEDQAIERGYAIHCPADGRFSWVGECEETKDAL